MYHSKAYFALFAVLMISSLAFSSDPAVVFVCYQDADTANALGCGCTTATRVPFADGTNMCIMWDANHATSPGPDTADVQISQGDGYGESNFGCTSFNGPDVGLATGFFCFDPGLVISQPVPSDSSWYYIKICATECQWYSASFQVLSGPSDVNLTPSDWTCSDSGCSFGADSESSTTESDENAMSWTFEDLMLGDSARGLTIYFDAAANELILRWPSVCAQAYQAYKVYSSASANGPFTTLVATTTDTSLTLYLPSGAKQFYTVVSYTDWDQMGIDHNRAASYIDSRLLQAGWDSTWTEAETKDSLREFTLDFMRDSTCYDYNAAKGFVSQFTFIVPSYEATLVAIDSLYTLGRISNREVTYLTRLFDLALADSDWSDARLNDSLMAYEVDLLAVGWNENETVCLQVSAVALYSWELREYGWQIANGDSLVGMDRLTEPTIGDIWDADVVGALCGAFAGPEGAFGGAVLGSTFIASRKLFMHLFM